jgi:hypothetical protein
MNSRVMYIELKVDGVDPLLLRAGSRSAEGPCAQGELLRYPDAGGILDLGTEGRRQ